MKKAFNITSAALHSTYLILFFLTVMCGALYHFFWDTAYWRAIADTGFIICFISMFGLIVTIPISLCMNVLSAVFSKLKAERIAWIVFSAISPFVLIFITMVQCAIIVGETGGV